MLARQLLIGFLGVTVPGTVALGAITLYSLGSLGTVSRQLTDITRSLEATRDLDLALVQAEATLAKYLVSRDRDLRWEFDQLIQAADGKAASCASARCHGPSRTPGQMAALIEPAIREFTRDGRVILAAAARSESVMLVRLEAAHRSLARIHEELRRMSGALLQRVENLGREVEVVGRRARILTISLTLAVPLIAAGVAIVVTQRISRPLRALLAGTRRLMAGDWASRVDIGDRGELGELASSFNTMMGELCQHHQRLEEYSRTLEQRVHERTEELRLNEQALLRSEKLASLGLLAAGVAHELNNPLTGITMNANLLMEGVGEGSPLYEDLRKIDADAGRCRRIVEDLRIFARRRELQKVASRVEPVVREALASVGPDLEARGIRAGCDVAPDVPAIHWDADRMLQVLANLFTNAAQAMADGGRLLVRGRCDDGWLRLEVLDTGTGIPVEHRSKIFDPFFTTKRDGTGLGLAIAHGIVNDHGGRIEVESRTRGETGASGETGTLVRIVLPIESARP